MNAKIQTQKFTASTKAARASRPVVVCQAQPRNNNLFHAIRDTGAAALFSAALLFSAQPAFAELNKYEEAMGGEFGRGTAQQYGEADIKGRNFSKQDLQRSNFTAADCRDCNFEDSKLQGAYFIKAVVARANFKNANLSDVLMDRAVMNEANLENAILQRAVFTRSDLGGANIKGADFTNALLDKTQQMALCKYAEGTNPVTGADTRKSLACGSRRAFKASTPSNPDGPQVDQSEKEAFMASQAVYRD